LKQALQFPLVELVYTHFVIISFILFGFFLLFRVRIC
jgi:hypothetical protein